MKKRAREIAAFALFLLMIFVIAVAGCSGGGGDGGGSSSEPTYSPTSSPTVTPTPTASPTVTPTSSPTVTPTPSPTSTPQDLEFYFNNPTSGAKIWAKVYYPPESNSRQKYPGLVMVPGGLGFGSSMDNAPQGPQEFAREGFVVMVFDPDGRGKSEGDEDYNGIIHQDALNELLKQLAADPFVNPDNIGVFTSSLGIALGAGALGRYPNNPTVHYLVDGEGPSDRFYITKFDDPHFVEIFDGHTTDDVEWWDEREAYRTIRTYPGMYLRLQTSRDHVHGDDMGLAYMMIENATAKQYGGLGVCSWTRINDDTNTPNTIYNEANLPNFLPPGSYQKLAPGFVKEMSGMAEGR